MPVQANIRKRKTVFANFTAKGQQQDTGKASNRWWALPKDEVHKGVWPVTEYILTNLAVRRRMNYFFAALYNDVGAQFMASRNVNLYYNRTALDGNAILGSNLTLNVLQNCIDTACALISKNKPRPQFLTDGSKDYATKVRGKELTKYVGGLFEETDIYSIAQKIFLDACIYGTGAVKFCVQDGKIKAENLFIEELLIDDLEGMHEAPTQIHQRKYLPRDQVIAMFPEHEEKIRSCMEISGGAATFSTADIICVIESWHLRSGKKAKDGIHSICIENCTLFCEEYTKDSYPILFFRWAYQTLGFWGRGISHEIWKLQRALDVVLQTIDRSQRLVSGPIIAVEAGSNIAEDHLTSNRLGKIIEYTETPPKFLTPPAVNPELYQHAQYLEDRMYKVSGISQANATGTKPPDVKAAVAIREVADIASGRFELVGQRWECLFLDIARVMVDLSADIDNASVMTADKGFAKRLNFKDVKADLEDCRLQLFPVSGLASSPQGRLDQLMDYAQAGYVSKEQVMEVAGFPDLEDEVSLVLAPYKRAREILSEIKASGKYTKPDPYLALAPTTYPLVCLEINRAATEGIPEDRIDLLRQWADEVKGLQDEAQAAQMQMQAQANLGTPSQQGSAQVGAQMAGQPQGQPPPPPPAPAPPMPMAA